MIGWPETSASTTGDIEDVTDLAKLLQASHCFRCRLLELYYGKWLPLHSLLALASSEYDWQKLRMAQWLSSAVSLVMSEQEDPSLR